MTQQTVPPIPKSQSYKTRNGSDLFFRLYPAQTDLAMILLHGISEDCKYLFPLAEFVSSNNLANVYTPDLRGYGENPVRRGDVDYIGQIEDDLADLINWIKTENVNAKIIMAGHSAGGGTAIRFMTGKYANLTHAGLMLAPHLGPGAPTEKPSDGMIQFYSKRMIGLFVLNRLGINKWSHLPILKINRPEDLRHGSETLELSFRLLMSRSILKYKKELPKLTKPALVLAGASDEVFYADKYPAVFSAFSNVTVQIVPNETHDGILSNKEIHVQVNSFLEGIETILKQ